MAGPTTLFANYPPVGTSGGGGGSPAIGGPITGGIAPAVLFVNPNGIIAQDPTNFNYIPGTGFTEKFHSAFGGAIIDQIDGTSFNVAESVANITTNSGANPNIVLGLYLEHNPAVNPIAGGANAAYYVAEVPNTNSTAFNNHFINVINAQLNYEGSSNASSGLLLSGFSLNANNDNNGNVSVLNGGDLNAYNNQNGAVDFAVGLLAAVNNEQSGQITLAIGGLYQCNNDGNGSIDSANGLVVQTTSNGGGGTIGSNNGLLVQDQSLIPGVIGTSYNIFSQGTNSLNRFQGTVEIDNLPAGGNIMVTQDTVTGILHQQSIPVTPPTIAFEHNSIANSSQTLLSIDNGTNTTVIDEGAGHLTINVNNPLQLANPSLISSTPIAIGPSIDVRELYVSGNYVYVASTTNIFIYDNTNPISLNISGSFSNGAATITSIKVAGRYLYSVDSNADFKIIDISDPAHMTQIGLVNITGGNPYWVTISGGFAYVANNQSSGKMQIIDISDPINPILMGFVTAISGFISVDVVDNIAVAVDNVNNLIYAIDVSNPAVPVINSNLPVGVNPWSVKQQGRYAYVANNATSSFTSYYISDSFSLGSAGIVTTSGNPQGFYLAGRYAYVTMTSGNMDIIDISDPTTPFIATTLSIGASAVGGPFVSGIYAYTASDGGGTPISVFDVTGIESIAILAHTAKFGQAQVLKDLIVQGNGQFTNGISVGRNGIFSDGEISTNEGLFSKKIQFLDGNQGVGKYIVDDGSGTGIMKWVTQPAAVNAGVYTPTITNPVNLTGTPTTAANSAQWMQVGNVITVSGQITDVNPTVTLTNTSFNISLPVASVFTQPYMAGGTAFCDQVSGQGAAISADTSNNLGKFTWQSVDTTNQTFFYSFTYRLP